MILNGKAIAAEILASVKKEVEARGSEPVVRALVMCPTAATESYMRIKTLKARKAGMRLELVRVENDASTSDLVRMITLPGADAVLVQLPIPESVDTAAVLNAIPLAQDADVLSTTTYERFVADAPGALLPPVVAAIADILKRAGVSVAGKRAVVIGNGRLVGAPTSLWLTREGAYITVLTEENFAAEKAALKEADIVVSGAGSAHLVTPDLLTEGVVLIDAGTSESNGAIAGDFDPACAEIASVFTPVPGGVGPVAVACLFKNTAKLLAA
jgi:methylenetetrahydrofolate dehydrogenase (NADP+)/methenyltetrahydrofolate cyclohydrolase